MKHIDIQATENEKKNNLKKEKVNLWAFALFIETDRTPRFEHGDLWARSNSPRPAPLDQLQADLDELLAFCNL